MAPEKQEFPNKAGGERVANTESSQPESAGAEGGFFEIRVKGHLDSQWSGWLQGLELDWLDNGETILAGAIVDQAALLGILNRLNHLNVAILAVSKIKGDQHG